jgi:hypothetical protein
MIVLLEWIAAIVIGMLGLGILIPRIFLRGRMSVPLVPIQKQNQIGRLGVGYREIPTTTSKKVVSVWYPCERDSHRKDQVISTTVHVGKLIYSMTGIKLFMFGMKFSLSLSLFFLRVPHTNCVARNR